MKTMRKVLMATGLVLLMSLFGCAQDKMNADMDKMMEGGMTEMNTPTMTGTMGTVDNESMQAGMDDMKSEKMEATMNDMTDQKMDKMDDTMTDETMKGGMKETGDTMK